MAATATLCFKSHKPNAESFVDRLSWPGSRSEVQQPRTRPSRSSPLPPLNAGRTRAANCRSTRSGLPSRPSAAGPKSSASICTRARAFTSKAASAPNRGTTSRPGARTSATWFTSTRLEFLDSRGNGNGHGNGQAAPVAIAEKTADHGQRHTVLTPALASLASTPVRCPPAQQDRPGRRNPHAD